MSDEDTLDTCKQSDCLSWTRASDGFCSDACRKIEALRRERDEAVAVAERERADTDKVVADRDRLRVQRDEALAGMREAEALVISHEGRIERLEARLGRAREAIDQADMILEHWQHSPFFDDKERWRHWSVEMHEMIGRWRNRVKAEVLADLGGDDA